MSFWYRIGCDESRIRMADEIKHMIGSSFDDLGLLVGLLRCGTKPTGYVLNKTLSCCAKSLYLRLGEQVHGMAVKMGFGLVIYVCSSLIDLYGKCGVVWDAQKLFDEMPQRNLEDVELGNQISVCVLKVGYTVMLWLGLADWCVFETG
ncbi:hypothetical protein QQ045_032714 [Rhodiola kirilowii]